MTVSPQQHRRRLALGLGLLVATPGCAAPRTGPPDVVLIVLDTLRPDHLGVYGYERETAPFLADWARRSVVFRRAFSASTWTAPSTASIFTSLFPVQHGVVEGIFVHEVRARTVAETGRSSLPLNRIPQAVSTLPEILKAAGYQTFGVASNVNIGPEIGFSRGFDRFDRLMDRDAGELFARLRDWESDFDATKPRFIYLHFDDVHEPYARREPWFEASGTTLGDLEAAYDSEISYVDDVLRQMFEYFDWDRDAIVVIASDHGEEFMEHGELGHGLSLHRELLQVLLLLRAPVRGEEGQIVTRNVTTLDLLPTLAELIGLEPREEWEGRSLVGLLDGDAVIGERTLFGHRRLEGDPPAELWTAVSGDWHLIERDGHFQLYNLSNDPQERLDLSAARRDVTARLAAELEAFRSSLRPHAAAETYEYELDPEGVERLRGLGYVE